MRNLILGSCLTLTVIFGSVVTLWGAPTIPTPKPTVKTAAATPKKTPPKKAATKPAPKKPALQSKSTVKQKSPSNKKSAPPKKPTETVHKKSPLPAPNAPKREPTNVAPSEVDVGALTDITGVNSREPTFIKSNSLTLDATARVFTYTGDVEVKQGLMTLTCGEIVGRYNARNQIETIDARRDVVIVKEDLRGTSQKAFFDAATNTITLSENPAVEQHGSILSADSIKVFLNENRSVAEGAVKVKLVEKPAINATPVSPTPG